MENDLLSLSVRVKERVDNRETRRTQWRRIGPAAKGLSIVFFVVSLCMVLMESTLAHAEHLTTVTKSHNEVTIRGYARWNKNCDAIEPPQIYLDVPPRNGFVCARTSRVTVRTVCEGNAEYCVGRSMPGIDLIYLPRSRFTVVDVVRYTVKFKAVSLSVDADINVPSDQAATESGGVSPSSEPPQTQGPIPVCASGFLVLGWRILGEGSHVIGHPLRGGQSQSATGATVNQLRGQP